MMNKITNNILVKILLIIFSALISSSNLMAQNSDQSGVDTALDAFVIVAILLIVVTLWLVLVYSEHGAGSRESIPMAKIRQFLTKSVPVEREAEILLKDHNFDGIHELDSRIPPWYSFLFYFTILFAFVYMIRYHVIGSGNVQAEEYLEEMHIAQVQKTELIKSGDFLNEENVTLLNDEVSLNAGKDIFMKNCLSCHGANGEGLVGPNLTDEYWLHGGGIHNIFKTIKYGVPAKGMISWQTQLDPIKIQQTASYIISLEGSNPANAKPPEGEIWKPANEENPSGDNT